MGVCLSSFMSAVFFTLFGLIIGFFFGYLFKILKDGK